MIPNAAVVEGNVPADVPSMSFNIGNSLAVSNKNHNNVKVITAPNNQGLGASIRVVGGDEDVRSDGSDPNIIGAQQVPAGTPVRQGTMGIQIAILIPPSN